MNGPTVSYVIPVFNGEAYLAQTVESLLAQTYALSQIIVVDDGSTDSTAEVAGRFGDRVTYVRQTNAGQSAARNHGVRLARGEFVGFLDADDLIQPIKVQGQIEQFKIKPELVLCDGYTRNFWSPEITDEKRDNDPKLLDPWAGHISSWLFRRGLFESTGGFVETMQFSEDTEWYLRVRDSGGGIHTAKEVLAYRRLHANNITRRRHDEHIDGIVRLYKKRVDQQKKMKAQK